MHVINSTPTPLDHACNTTLFYYTPNPGLPPIKDLLHDCSIRDDLLSPYVRGILQVCFLYHCRVSELLLVSFSDIIHPDRVICTGLKRSNSYVIYLPGLSAQIDTCNIIHESDKLFQATYSNLYRSCLRAGIRLDTHDSKTTKRLHVARFLFCKDAIKITDEANVSQCMRHRALSSLQYYL